MRGYYDEKLSRAMSKFLRCKVEVGVPITRDAWARLEDLARKLGRINSQDLLQVVQHMIWISWIGMKIHRSYHPRCFSICKQAMGGDAMAKAKARARERQASTKAWPRPRSRIKPHLKVEHGIGVRYVL